MAVPMARSLSRPSWLARAVCCALFGAAPAVPAASTSATQALLDHAEVQARVDPDASKREAESVLVALQKQPDADLAIRAHLLLCDYYSERDRDAAQRQIDAASALLGVATRPGLRAGILNCQGESFETIGDNAQASSLYDQAVQVAGDAHDDEMLAEALFSRGYLRGLSGNYADGLADLRRAQALFENLHLPQQALTALDSIAIIYNRMGDFDEAEHLYENAIDAQRRAGLTREEAITWYNLGRARENLQKLEPARTAYNESLRLNLQLKYLRGQAYSWRGLASVNAAQGDASTALSLLDKASNLQKQVPDARLAAQIQLLRGTVLHQLKRLSEAASELQQALVVFRQADSPGELGAVYDELAGVEADLGNWRDAYDYRTLAKSTATRLLRNQIDQRFATLKVEFDTETREKENALLTLQNDANQKTLAQKQRAGKLQNTVIALTVLLAAVLAAIMIYQRRNTRRMRALAMTDELTGAPNRRAILGQLNELLRESPDPTSLLIIDIDHFKTINDRHGHLVGDETLRALTTHLVASLGQAGYFGRLGGEEFAAILPATGIEQAVATAERVREQVMQIDLSRWLGERRLTVSIGVATSTPLRDSITGVLRRADTALYAAKDAGRNCVRRSSVSAALTPRVA